jgi:hypothetical protein
MPEVKGGEQEKQRSSCCTWKEKNMSGQFGYTGSILRVDLSTGHFAAIATNDYADRFVGGRGVAAKIYWDEVSPEI